MKYKNRKSPRAKWHNYFGASYFVTINTKDRKHYFGEIKDENIYLSRIGAYLKEQIENTKIVRADEIDIPCYTIMPDHVHLIVSFNNCNNQIDTSDTINTFGPQRKNLPSVIRGIKSKVKSFANENNIPFEWHGRYYNRIIRDCNEMNNIADYIENNPIRWEINSNDHLCY